MSSAGPGAPLRIEMSTVILKIIWRRSLRIIWRAGRLCRSPRSGARWAIRLFAGPSAATAAKHGVAAGMYFIPPEMDPNFFVQKGFKFFTMPWAPWAKAGIQNGLAAIKR